MNRIYPSTGRRRAARGRSLLVILVGVILVSSLAGTVLAQSSANYTLEWYLVGGSAQVSSSGNYVVQGTAGQAAVSPPFPFSIKYAVSGGFWLGDSPPTFDWVYLPLMMRNY